MSRSFDLLYRAANALEDGIDPFESSWLSENEVTLDEAYDLSDQLALGARMLIASRKDMSSRPGGLSIGAAAIVAGLMEIPDEHE